MKKKDKKVISDYYAHEDINLTVEETLPGFDNPEELVANGPQPRNRGTAVRNRLFLWRNAIQGASFATRFERLQQKK